MTAGFFSPLPPARTGVADYSSALLAALAQKGTVRAGDETADICLYHLGNNQLHRTIYARAMARPGVVVLHDAVLHHFLLGSLTEQEYVSEFVYNYGRWSEDLARRLWRDRARSGSDPQYFRYPLLKRVVERSLGVIVHNPAAARMVREHVPDARIHEIPHLFVPGPAPAEYEVVRLRESMGLRPSTFLFGVFGHLRESKRLRSVLEAFRTVYDAGERVALLVAGEFASQDLERSLAVELAAPGILRVGYTPEIAFRAYSEATDACINLRYPTAGETSGIAVRLMGMGKPVLLTSSDETADIPLEAAIRVDPGLVETDMLIQFMFWLSRFHADAAGIGRRARIHIAGRHSVDRVADLYWNAMAEACA